MAPPLHICRMTGSRQDTEGVRPREREVIEADQGDIVRHRQSATPPASCRGGKRVSGASSRTPNASAASTSPTRSGAPARARHRRAVRARRASVPAADHRDPRPRAPVHGFPVVRPRLPRQGRPPGPPGLQDLTRRRGLRCRPAHIERAHHRPASGTRHRASAGSLEAGEPAACAAAPAVPASAGHPPTPASGLSGCGSRR